MKLKTLIGGCVLAGLMAAQASAQTFNIGLEAGANFSNFVGSTDVSSFENAKDSKLGFVGGGFVCLNFGENFSVRPEILYAQKGAAISGTSTSVQLDYIEFPVLLKLSLGSPMVNPAVLLGPTFSLNTVASMDGVSISDVNSSDIGLMVGVEVDIDKFLVSGRYEIGFQNVVQNINVQNGTFTFLVGYMFM
jgi:hypothetical protein